MKRIWVWNTTLVANILANNFTLANYDPCLWFTEVIFPPYMNLGYWCYETGLHSLFYLTWHNRGATSLLQQSVFIHGCFIYCDRPVGQNETKQWEMALWDTNNLLATLWLYRGLCKPWQLLDLLLAMVVITNKICLKVELPLMLQNVVQRYWPGTNNLVWILGNMNDYMIQ